jgi:hypothetical protein
MKRVVVAALVGVALGAGIASLVFLTRPHRIWQEQEARSEASGLACNLTPGLSLACEPIREFRSDGLHTWRLRIEGPGHHMYCYELQTFRPPLQQPCH